jgi:hypothetical protein
VTVGEEGVTGIAQTLARRIGGKLKTPQESTDKHGK